ncbi:hypothetical protein ACI8AA_22400 [Geodermatophilus sp. SYSU D01180]
MTTSWGPLPEARILSGDEPIGGAGATLRDFWAWAYSDLRTNTVRPLLAEYLVARAVGADPRPRVEWDSYDVLTPEGLRLEVKSGAYLQAWEQSKLSSITFGGLRARVWTDGGPVGEPTYNADGYVFAVLTAEEHASYDALDLGQWSFWVLPRARVVATGQASMGLARVEALAGPPVPYAGLAGRIREVVVREG